MSNKDPNEIDILLSRLARSPRPSQDAATPDATREESATLSTLDQQRRPNPMPVCGACPHSMWFASADELKCHCRMMHVITWSSDEPVAITACDGVLVGE